MLIAGMYSQGTIASPRDWQPCFESAGRYYSVSPDLLRAIASAESNSDPLALNTSNSNGSWDIGLMQINSRWIGALGAFGITAQDLYDPCTSIWVGAWVLAQNVARYGYEWEAVGAYNAGTSAKATAHERRQRYAHRVHRHLECGARGLC